MRHRHGHRRDHNCCWSQPPPPLSRQRPRPPLPPPPPLLPPLASAQRDAATKEGSMAVCPHRARRRAHHDRPNRRPPATGGGGRLAGGMFGENGSGKGTGGRLWYSESVWCCGGRHCSYLRRAGAVPGGGQRGEKHSTRSGAAWEERRRWPPRRFLVFLSVVLRPCEAPLRRSGGWVPIVTREAVAAGRGGR